MLAFLNGIPGKLKILTDRLTSTRAGYLDKLNITGNVASANTAVSNADYTSARAGYLDHLNMAAGKIAAAEDTPLLDTPIANGLFPNAAYQSMPSSVAGYTGGGAYGTAGASTITTGSWVQAVNYTGAGVLELLAHSAVWGGSSVTAYVQCIIDGVTVVDASVSLTNANRMGAMFCGGVSLAIDTSNNQALVALPIANIPFKSSLVIQHKSGSTSGDSRLVYKYRKTA